MRLPNGENAYVDPAKLRDYFLDPEHPRGKHKARIFNATLGITLANQGSLRDALLKAARTDVATVGEPSEYGKRYAVEFRMKTPVGEATVRSGWIVRQDEDFPRLTSCYVMRRISP